MRTGARIGAPYGGICRTMKLRRDFLASLVRLAGVSAIGAVAPSLSSEAQQAQPGRKTPTGKVPAGTAPNKEPAKIAPKDIQVEGLPAYARAQNYKSMKQSSWDRKGGNYDWWQIEAGGTHEVFTADGPGVITHLWFTFIQPRIRRGDAMKAVVLRMFWDGSEKPSVEVPICDFFGMNTGEFFTYQSAFLNVASRGMNCYFAMPYKKSARVTISNEADGPMQFYANIDYKLMHDLPSDAMYFHAQYRQSVPTSALKAEGAINLDGKGNYIFLETRGRGHFMGVTWGVIQCSDGWWGEGDDMTFIDDEVTPSLNGTGAEDYLNAGYGLGTPFAYLYNGAPHVIDPDKINGRACMYRWHADCPITFQKYFKHTIEHGEANNRADMYYSVAYWYAAEIADDFPQLPPVAERSTRLMVQAAG